MKNPTAFNPFNNPSVFVKSLYYFEVRERIIPNNQISTVLAVSARQRAIGLIYFVTETPIGTEIPMETINPRHKTKIAHFSLI